MSKLQQLRSYEVIKNAFQHEIDRISADLGAVRAAQADAEKRIEHLDTRRDTESHPASLEAAQFVAGFLQAISVEQKAIQRQLDGLNDAASDLEERLRAKYLEFQTWRITCDRLQSQIDEENQKRETEELDEVARNGFLMRKQSEPRV